jgi:hypothetical protein
VWFHFYVAAPISNPSEKPSFDNAVVHFTTNGSSIRNVSIYDGQIKIREFAGLSVTGDFSKDIRPANTWAVNPYIPLRSHTVGILLAVQFAVGIDSPIPSTQISFTKAGVAFRQKA